MSIINCVKKFFWSVGLIVSAYYITPVEGLLRASPPASSLSVVTPSLAKTQPTSSIPNPIFSKILPVLKVQTQLTIRLPTYIPETDGSNSIYALMETATAKEYRILLAFTSNCTGGNACRLGSIFAQAITLKTPTLTGKVVSLANGITGYFTDAICGANCSDATLVWEQNYVRYAVAIKAGKVATLVKMANPVIAIAPILPQKAKLPPDAETKLISAAGIGQAKLGMTLGQLKRILGADTEFRVESPFMVDIDAIAVRQSGQVQYYILYDAGTTLGDTDQIQTLLTDNPKFRTAQGVGAGTSLKQAEAIYGSATLSYNTSNESREYVSFANEPQENISFRPVAVGQNFAGIYLSPLSPQREFNETKIFQSTAKIRLVGVVYLSPSCTNP